jgi:hypothetical protein
MSFAPPMFSGDESCTGPCAKVGSGLGVNGNVRRRADSQLLDDCCSGLVQLNRSKTIPVVHGHRLEVIDAVPLLTTVPRPVYVTIAL